MKRTIIGSLVLTSVGFFLLFQNFSSTDQFVLESNDSRFTGYDIIIIAGQSNAVGPGRWVGEKPVDALQKFNYDDRIFQVNRYSQMDVIQAADPLQHFGYYEKKDTIGFGMSFARNYVSGMNKNRKVILVPAAMGGTSIDEWLGNEEVIDRRINKPVKLKDDLIARVQFALGYGIKPQTQNRVVALLWQHGEADIRKTHLKLDGMTPELYVTKIHSLFGKIKRALPESERDFSIIIGEPVPTWTLIENTNLNIEKEKAAFKKVLIAYTQESFKRKYVVTKFQNSTDPLASNCVIGASNDCVHYNAESQIKLGRLYYNAYIKTIAGHLAELRITGSEAHNASPNIVDYASKETANQASHFIDIGQPNLPVKIGVDERGGGYINYLELFQDGVNRVAPKFGRGIQTAFRDELHGRKYNPTQAGFSDEYGAKVTIVKEESALGKTSALRLPQFNVPLFNGDAEFDYVENSQTLKSLPSNYDPEKDWDNVDERGKTYSDEIKSEFDFSGKYERATDEFQMPALRHTMYFALIRKPDAIKQFIDPASYKYSGEKLLDVDKIIEDISPVAGVQTPNITDMSDIRFATMSGRFLWDPVLFANFYYYYKVNGAWTGKRLAIDPTTGDKIPKEKMPQPFQLINQTARYVYKNSHDQVEAEAATQIDEDLLIVSNVCHREWVTTCPGSVPAKKVSIAYYYPINDKVNKYPVVVMNRSDLSIHREEDRIMHASFALGYRDLNGVGFVVPRVELKLSGLMSSQRYLEDKHQQRFEAIRQKIYMLFAATPDEIVRKVDAYKARQK